MIKIFFSRIKVNIIIRYKIPKKVKFFVKFHFHAVAYTYLYLLRLKINEIKKKNSKIVNNNF